MAGLLNCLQKLRLIKTDHLVHQCEVEWLPSTIQNKYNLNTKTTEKKTRKWKTTIKTEQQKVAWLLPLAIFQFSLLFIKGTSNSKYRFLLTLFKTESEMMMHMHLTEVSQLFKSFLTACGQTVYTFCTHLNFIHSSSLGWTQSVDTDMATEWKQKKTPFTVSWKALRPG